MARFKLNETTSIGTAVFSAVSLKLCCWGPLLLTSVVGVSGSSVYFSWLNVFKPYLLIIAFLSLGLAFYQVYRPKKEGYCSGNCESEKTSFFKSKLYIWLVATFVILMTVISYYPRLFHLSTEREIIIMDKSNIQSVELNIQGMTCSGCEENINQSIKELYGILNIKSSYENGNAYIEFDNSKITVEKIEKAVNSTGYKINNIKRKKVKEN